jgi:hypothetical protein
VLLLLLLLFNPVPKRNAGASSSGGGGGGGGGGSGRAPSSFSSLDGCGGISRRRLFSFLNYFINCDDDDDDVFLSLFSVDVEHKMLLRLKKVFLLESQPHTRTQKRKRKRKLIVVTKSTHVCCALVNTDTRTLPHSITNNINNIFFIFFHT